MKEGAVAVTLLAEAHHDALEQLEPGAGTARRLLAEREAGTGHGLVIEDRGVVVGYCELSRIEGLVAHRLGCVVAPERRGQGYGSFGTGLTLELGFRNLRLDRIVAEHAGTDPAWRRILAKQGFDAAAAAPELTPERWREFRNGPNLSRLHPELRHLLALELGAGNEVEETGGGWPDPDSVFVRLRDPFRRKPVILPDGVRFTEVNDSHWWQAEYSTTAPRHLLVY